MDAPTMAASKGIGDATWQDHRGRPGCGTGLAPPIGQNTAQLPQSMHAAVTVLRSFVTTIAPPGHTEEQPAQCVHTFWSIVCMGGVLGDGEQEPDPRNALN